MPDLVGPQTGTNDRPHDQDRADLIANVLASVGLTVPTSYVDLGPTRFPWAGQGTHQKPSVIDYIFASQKLITEVHTSHLPTPDTSTDHIPIGMTAHAPYASRRERRQLFESQQANAAYWKDRVPSRWEPSTLSGLRNRLKHTRFNHLNQVAPELVKAAKASTSVDDQRQSTKRGLLQCIKKASDPIIRKAYQIRLRQYRREQRENRERAKILAWARGDNWDFSRESKIPHRMKYPQTLNGEPDRGHWGEQLGRYLHTLYAADPQEEEDIHAALLRILEKARRQTNDHLVCNPNELRDILRALPPHKAAGPDGVPSQLLKALTIQQIVDISKLFTDLANDLDFKPDRRPAGWSQNLAMLLPKEAKADTLDRHRAIALMSQLQKLYSKWLLAQMTPTIDPLISEHQAGFRRNRQASEILHIISKLIELALEWQTPLTIMRLDMRKAFDRVKQSAILETLENSPLHPKIVFNAARELVGNTMHPTIYGCIPEDPIPLAQGTKQGAPESGLYFVATLNHALSPLKEKWDHTQAGCVLGDTLIHHLIFADDLLLVGPSPHGVLNMFSEVKPALRQIGLEVNDAKTAYLTTHPQLAQHLPGTNANSTGMKILGRTFTLTDNTQQDMDIKIGHAWARFNRLRHVLRAPTPLPHRIRIFKSCVGQALLWASETWHLTRRRLQRVRGVELAMMRTLIPCPPLPPDTDDATRFSTHKAHIRKTLADLQYEGLDRQWVKKYYSWAGHLARLPAHRIAKKAFLEKNLAWWRRQQQNPHGHRHTRRRGNISRWENPLGRHHPSHENWPESAQFRDRWKLFFPAFEKRLFGANSPHQFDPNAEKRHPEPPPSSIDPGHGCPGRTLSAKPPEARSSGPEVARRRPPGNGKHPRDASKPRPEVASRLSPGKGTHPTDTSRGPNSSAGEGPPPKQPKILRAQNPAPHAVLTPSEMARNWERALNSPLIQLVRPQDDTHRARLGKRAGSRAGKGGRGVSLTTLVSKGHPVDEALPGEASQTSARDSRAAGGAAGSTATRANVRRNGRGSARSTAEGAVKCGDSKNQCELTRPHRWQGAPSAGGRHSSRGSSGSSSTSSSTSTSSSWTSTSDGAPHCKGKEKGERQGRWQRQKEFSKGKGKGRSGIYRKNVGTQRVLGQHRQAAVAHSNRRRRRRQERRQDDDSNDDDGKRERRQEGKSMDGGGSRERRQDGNSNDDDGQRERRQNGLSNDDDDIRQRRQDGNSNDDKSNDDDAGNERPNDDEPNDDNDGQCRVHDERRLHGKSNDDERARERRLHGSSNDDDGKRERRQHGSSNDDKSNDDDDAGRPRMGQKRAATSSSSQPGQQHQGSAQPRALERRDHPPSRPLRRSHAMG